MSKIIWKAPWLQPKYDKILQTATISVLESACIWIHKIMTNIFLKKKTKKNRGKAT